MIRKFRIHTVIAAILLFNLILTTNAFAACDTIRIMPVGDSITYDNYSGDTRPPGLRTAYRQPLWIMLNDAGYNVDFVGSRIAGEDAIPDFDPDNEGYPGWTDDEIAANIYDFLVDNPADIILLHIGTNGLSADPAQVEDILNEIDRFENDYNQHVIVVLARIINRATYSSETTQFNNNVQLMAENRILAGDDIAIVDMEDSAGLIYELQPNGDMIDFLHPTEAGYTKMASVWFDELIDILPACDPANPHLYLYPSSILIQMRTESVLTRKVKIGTSGLTETNFVVQAPIPNWLTISPSTGGTPDTLEFNFNTSGLPTGVYLADITINATDGTTSSVTIPITLVVANQIMLSQSPNRANAVPLSGETVSGDVYIFVSSVADIQQVQFFIDNPAMVGTPDKVEGLPPYDLGGTEDATLNALPFDTGGLLDGEHTLTTKIVMQGGAEEIVNTTFTVANIQLLLNKSALAFAAEEGSGLTAIQTIDIATSDGGPASYTIGSIPAWLNISNQTGNTPNTLSVWADVTGLSPGFYQADITATDDAGAYEPASFTVNLTVTTTGTGQYEALLSESANRSNAVPLSGETVSGDVYVFVSPEAGIQEVQFFIDNPAMVGTPDKVEGLPPYDLGGTDPATSNALPFDTGSLLDGEHTLTLKIVTQGGAEEIVNATFTAANAKLVFNKSALAFVAEEGSGLTAIQTIDIATSNGGPASYTLGSIPAWLNINNQTGNTPNTLSVWADVTGLSPGSYQAVITATDDAGGYGPASFTVSLTVTAVGTGGYEALVSESANRSNAVPLSGETVSGDVYVFVSPEAGIQEVQFFIDNPAMVGTPDKVEGLPPYDLGGTDPATSDALPFDTGSLLGGEHTLTLKIVTQGGAEEIVNATFTVANTKLVFNKSALAFAAEEGSGLTAIQAIDIATSDDGPASYTLGSIPAWLNINDQTGNTPNTLSVWADVTGLPPGSYQAVITATDDAGGYGPGSFTVSLTVTAVGTGGYEALVSESANRSNAVPLSGETVSGDVYVFVSPEAGIQQVQFFIDNPTMVGTPDKVENLSPFDLGGTDPTTSDALPFDSGSLLNGQHALTVKIVTQGGAEEIVNATFTVAN